MYINKLFFLLLIVLCSSCMQDSEKEKRYNFRETIIHVQEQVKEITIEDVFIGSICRLFLADDYLIIGDSKTVEKQIHFFDKNTFAYITSTADRGQGPYEITTIGHIEYDKTNRKIYVTDHGKQRIFSYDLDSVFTDPQYRHSVKMKMERDLFPDEYQYINDTLSFGKVIAPIGNADYEPTVAKWNMNTGKIDLMKYKNPRIEKKRFSFAASMEHGIYVECYSNYDLMTICSLDGELKWNVYGRKWTSRRTSLHYYDKVAFCNDKIVAAYSGEDYYRNYEPTKLIVFDINGNYIKTLETGYKMMDFCFDQDNNRILMASDSEIQFAYLDLDGII